MATAAVTSPPPADPSIDEKVPEPQVSIPAQPSQPVPASNSTVDGSSNPTKTLFIHPTTASKTPPPQPLTPDQSSKYDAVLTTVKSWTEIPTTSSPNAPKTPLTDSERMWLTRECLLRFLRASKWSVPKATSRLVATLTWRREYGLESHTADYISEENETGKQLIIGYDNEGRPLLYLYPANQNTKGKEKQIQHLVFMLERCIDLMPPGQETLALLVNFKESRRGESSSIGQARQTLHILQSHYPERLGRALVQDVPWLIWGFFKAITPFIDPQTSEKMKFDQDLTTLVPREQLLTGFGGEVEFVYEHGSYWGALNGLADGRRRAMVERWEMGGKRVGEEEGYLRGGEREVGEVEV